jgi:disulfide bond formation protein DsbB
MAVSARATALALGLAAAVVLGLAFALEHLVGMRPCHLCLLERWPWAVAAAVLLGSAGLRRPRAGLALGLVALLVGTGLGLYQLGVEQGVFALPETCAAAGQAASVEELLRQLQNAPPPCDQVSTLFGISLAAWNVLASIAGVIVAAWGLRRLA